MVAGPGVRQNIRSAIRNSRMVSSGINIQPRFADELYKLYSVKEKILRPRFSAETGVPVRLKIPSGKYPLSLGQISISLFKKGNYKIRTL